MGNCLPLFDILNSTKSSKWVKKFFEACQTELPTESLIAPPPPPLPTRRSDQTILRDFCEKSQDFTVTVSPTGMSLPESSNYRFCPKCFTECHLMKCKSGFTVLQIWISLMPRTSNNSRPVLRALCSAMKTMASLSQVWNSV